MTTTPVSSPAPKMRPLGYLESVAEEPPKSLSKSHTKKIRDHQVDNAFAAATSTTSTANDRSTAAAVAAAAAVDDSLPIPRNNLENVASNLQNAFLWKAEQSSKKTPSKQSSENSSLKSEEYSFKSELKSEMLKPNEADLQAKLNKSLSRVFEQQKSESRRAIISINEICRHIICSPIIRMKISTKRS